MTIGRDTANMARGGGRTKAKQGTIRKRTPPDVRGGWEARAELGIQPAQKCLACGRRRWIDHRRLKGCPTCGGELQTVQERRQVTKGSFATKKDAQAWLDGVRVARREGRYRPIGASDARLTVADLTDSWLEFIETQVKPSTARSYQMYCAAYIVPRLGSVRLQDLSPEAIEAFYHDLLENGRIRGGGGLKARSVRHCAAALHALLAYGVRKRLLQLNPADLAEPPARDAVLHDGSAPRLPGGDQRRPAALSVGAALDHGHAPRRGAWPEVGGREVLDGGSARQRRPSPTRR